MKVSAMSGTDSLGSHAMVLLGRLSIWSGAAIALVLVSASSAYGQQTTAASRVNQPGQGAEQSKEVQELRRSLGPGYQRFLNDKPGSKTRQQRILEGRELNRPRSIDRSSAAVAPKKPLRLPAPPEKITDRSVEAVSPTNGARDKPTKPTASKLAALPERQRNVRPGQDASRKPADATPSGKCTDEKNQKTCVAAFEAAETCRLASTVLEQRGCVVVAMDKGSAEGRKWLEESRQKRRETESAQPTPGPQIRR